MQSVKLGYCLALLNATKDFAKQLSRPDFPRGSIHFSGTGIDGALDRLIELRAKFDSNDLEWASKTKGVAAGLAEWEQRLKYSGATPRVDDWQGEEQENLAKVIQSLVEMFQSEGDELLFAVNPEYLREKTTFEGQFHSDRYVRLPRIVQTRLQIATDCLQFGQLSASISIALQAVESMTRYVYFRLGGTFKNDENHTASWNGMREWLHGRRQGFIGEQINETLEELIEIRNALAHGRQQYQQIHHDRATDILRDCYQVIQQLLRGTRSTRNHFKIELETSSLADFDCAVALYLFHWNSEFPVVQPGNISVRSEWTGQRFIKDTTQRITENGRGNEWEKNEKSLTQNVLDGMLMQSNVRALVSPLINAVNEWYESERLQITSADSLSFSIAHLVEAATDLHAANHEDAIVEIWGIFDEFVDGHIRGQGVSWREPEFFVFDDETFVQQEGASGGNIDILDQDIRSEASLESISDSNRDQPEQSAMQLLYEHCREMMRRSG